MPLLPCGRLQASQSIQTDTTELLITPHNAARSATWQSNGPTNQSSNASLSSRKRWSFTNHQTLPSLTLSRYKTVASYDIKAAVILPPNLKAGKHPVIINIHGGYFSFASSLFPAFFYPWSLDIADEHNAIIVSADYRLLPTANGISDICEDIEDFWQWTRSELPSVLERHAPGHTLDYSQTLLLGGSAGGYCVAQLALSHPDEISVVAMMYPCVDPTDELYTKGVAEGAPTPLRIPREQMPSKEDSLAWVAESQKTITSKEGWERAPYCVALTTYGLIYDKMIDPKGLDDPATLPLKRIEAGAKLPKNV